MIQVILLIKDAEETIEQVVESYTNRVDRIVVFIDRATTDNTRQIVLRLLGSHYSINF